MEMVSAPGAPDVLLPHGSETAVVDVLGVTAVVAYRRDVCEHRRRREAGTGALRRIDVLELLMGLPEGEPVPIASLGEVERRALKAMPPGVVVRQDGNVIRRAIEPVRVALAVVPARGWDSALEKVERFTPFCARAVLVEGTLRRRADALMQADFYGIGLWIASGDGVDVLVPPRPFVRKRYTAAGWRFAEDVYRQLM